MARAATLVLPEQVRRSIVAHARREAPRECCGLLIGRAGVVSHAVEMRNTAASRTRYRLDPREHIDVRRVLRAFRPPLDIVGVYHSHPDGSAEPSATDLAEALYAEWTYVIVGLAGNKTRLAAFHLQGSTSRPVTLRRTRAFRR
jgi:proteasome lid subunit RPN8/RPN11